jgi:hypothetical protein
VMRLPFVQKGTKDVSDQGRATAALHVAFEPIRAQLHKGRRHSPRQATSSRKEKARSATIRAVLSAYLAVADPKGDSRQPCARRGPEALPGRWQRRRERPADRARQGERVRRATNPVASHRGPRGAKINQRACAANENAGHTLHPSVRGSRRRFCGFSDTSVMKHMKHP